MSLNHSFNTKRCLICQSKHNTLYWHDPGDNESGLNNSTDIWCYCNRCDRGYSIYDYCTLAGLSLSEFLTNADFEFQESRPYEVQKMEWPRTFVPLFDKRATEGVEYIKSRSIELDDGMYYDTYRKGIVFPYYYDNVFCGAQVRLIEPWIDEDGQLRKIDTVPGTRLGLLFYGWNQTPLPGQIKGVIVCEGAFNALAISQALTKAYGGMLKNPWKCVATSGSGASSHHIETIKELKDQGLKIVVAGDTDEAGLKMLKKFIEADAATHYALTDEDGKDWNDVSKTMSREEFAKWFIGRIKSV